MILTCASNPYQKGKLLKTNFVNKLFAYLMISTCASNPYQKGKLLKTNNLIRNIKIFSKQM